LHTRRSRFKKIPAELGIDELFVGGREKCNLRLRWDPQSVSKLAEFFHSTGSADALAERVHIRPLRKIALKKAEKWMLERFEMSDGFGANLSAMLNAIIALRCLGYSMDDPQVIRAIDEF